MTENLSSSRDQTTDRISKQQRRSNKGLLNVVLCCFVKRGVESRSNLQQLRHLIILRAIPPRCPFVFRQGLNTFTKRSISVSYFFTILRVATFFLDLKITSNRTFLRRTYIGNVNCRMKHVAMLWNKVGCYKILIFWTPCQPSPAPLLVLTLVFSRLDQMKYYNIMVLGHVDNFVADFWCFLLTPSKY